MLCFVYACVIVNMCVQVLVDVHYWMHVHVAVKGQRSVTCLVP